MLKFYDVAVVMQEFPDEIALAVNITGCICNCSNCSEPWLRQDIGEELSNDKIDELINAHPDITVFGLMGGDSDYDDVVRIANYIHNNYNIKVGMYSGRDQLNMKLLECLDYYKIGRWINPIGPVSEWHKTSGGVIQFPWSNQLMFEKIDNNWVNITYKFRKEKIGNPERYIIFTGNNEN